MRAESQQEVQIAWQLRGEQMTGAGRAPGDTLSQRPGPTRREPSGHDVAQERGERARAITITRESPARCLRRDRIFRLL